ncbi:diacylglycerol kinase [Parashewanella curva]|uniref:Diacylglycerol kinase n=1 Tax=Parashewanella curva TaxID=2338552 RepID=A0A3L8Q235_9GAMM|nr:diacylglycerol kinase [Parashewanella curva]RLV61726.1 diacylglycerol kinase [Parashewanella curva]
MEKQRGFKRLISAFKNSNRALTWLLKNEAAFKQEAWLLLISIPVSFIISSSIAEQLLLISSVVFVMFAEVINTAIEAVVDRVGLEHHELSGLAKDLGSLAVLISLLLCLLAWCYVIVQNF